jgi:hypothetical protein
MDESTVNVYARASVGISATATVAFAQPLWSQWAIAAVEQRDASMTARAELIRDRDEPLWYLAAQREMRASMLSIVAAAFAIEGWGFASRGDGAGKTLGSAGVIGIINRRYKLPTNLKREMVVRVEELFNHRGELAHHKSPSRDGRHHPVLGNSPYESGIYTCEAATEACKTLREVVELCLAYPHPDCPPEPAATDHARLVVDTVVW